MIGFSEADFIPLVPNTWMKRAQMEVPIQHALGTISGSGFLISRIWKGQSAGSPYLQTPWGMQENIEQVILASTAPLMP